MSAKLKASKLMSVMAVLGAITIVVSYLVMSDTKTDNTVYYTELAVYALVGIIFLLGIRLAGNARKTVAILAGCVSLFLPIFIIPCLTAENRRAPYLFLLLLYAKRTMTVACPFLSTGLLKWLCTMTEGRRYRAALASFSYFAIAFAVIALLQGTVKWQYSHWYGINTTWNAVETFYWAVTVNAVYIWHMRRNTADSGNDSGRENGSRENDSDRENGSAKWNDSGRENGSGRGDNNARWYERKRSLIYAVIADVAVAIVVVWKSRHLRRILQDFAAKLTEGGPIYALRNSTWLSYRAEIFKGVIGGEYSVGESVFLENFPDEFPICVSWALEPLVSTRLAYGWPATLVLLVLFAVLIVLLYAIGSREQPVDEIGVWIRYSFTALTCLSFVSQTFVPAYGLIMPLMGDGACMIALLVVYIALPKLRAVNNACMGQH